MINDNSSGCTIIIAHRLTTVKTCDKIIVMEKGCIKESGTHDELLKVPIQKSADGKHMVAGWYHDLWETQHGKDVDKERLEFLEQENSRLRKELSNLKADKVNC